MEIGNRLRIIREERQMTLKQLSEASGVQIATISRIENGKMTGTLESHMSMAKALGVDITELYIEATAERKQRIALGHEATETFTYNEKASYEILATKILSKRMMPILLKIEPGGKTNQEQNPLGSEKFVFIIEGEIKVHIDKQACPLSPGKTLYFDAALPHYYENSGTHTAKLISIVSPVIL